MSPVGDWRDDGFPIRPASEATVAVSLSQINWGTQCPWDPGCAQIHAWASSEEYREHVREHGERIKDYIEDKIAEGDNLSNMPGHWLPLLGLKRAPFWVRLLGGPHVLRKEVV